MGVEVWGPAPHRTTADTVVVLTINDTNRRWDTVLLDSFRIPEKSRVFGFWGEYGRKAET
jgi:hypothetical protein